MQLSTATRTKAQGATDAVGAVLSLLDEANANAGSLPDMASRLLAAVASLQAATSARFGVDDMLRGWGGMLKLRASFTSAFLSPVDVACMVDWFGRLHRYLDGTLPASERCGLAQFPSGISWMPQLSPRFASEIERRLGFIPPEAVADQAACDIALLDCTAAPVQCIEASLFAQTTGAKNVCCDGEDHPDTPWMADAEPNGPARASDVTAVADDLAPADMDEAIVIVGTSPWVLDAQAESGEPSDAAEPDAAAFDEQPAADPLTSEADALSNFELEEPHAQVASEGDVAADDRFIWISEEERELTQNALAQQLMPLAQQWSGGDSEELQIEAIEALSYQFELIANVLDLVGTQHLATGMRAIREEILARSPNMDPERTMQWCAGMLAVVDQPGAESALLLASLAEGIPTLDIHWAGALAGELERVRVGRDPAHIAARKREANVDDVALLHAADTLPTVLEGMLRELPGNTARLGATVRAAVLQGDIGQLDEARRVAHTLKGDANTVGVRGLASITHALEDILVAYDKRGGTPDPLSSDLLIDATDKVEEIADFLLGRGPHPDGLLDLYQRLLGASNNLEDAPSAPSTPTAARDAEEPIQEETTDVPSNVQWDAQTPIAGVQASVRNLTLGSDVLDHLQSLSGEAMIVAQGIDRLLEGVVELRRDQDASARYSHELITRLDDLVALRGAALKSTAIASGTDLDPLEIDQYNELHVISRQLAEAQADSSVALRSLRRSLGALADLRSEQEQINRELQRSILRTRMVPFGQITPRLQRIVRQTAKQLMKLAELDVVGEETLIDAELLERIVEPMGHLIRNAIDHGLESAEQRRRAGKPATSRLKIEVGVQGDSAIISVRDDGCGLDLEAIRARATAMGLLPDGAPSDERSLTRLVLLPGFSTRATTTELSGRGVGMDVVSQRVTQLRGSLQLDSRAGRGLEVKIRVPITQTIANVIIARGQHHVTAVVASSVEQIVGFAAKECAYDEASKSLHVTIKGELFSAIPIETVYREGADVSDWLSSGGVGLLVRDMAGNASLVLVRAVDEVRSVLVKPISAFLPAIPSVRGITQLPDGGLAPVVDLDQLLARGTATSEVERALRFTPARQVPRIVVADDSLSARRSLEQLMRDAGYEVDVANDGFETISQVEARPTAALLLDMEMPRMNGLEVTRNLRSKASSRGLPILMITSRTAEKHRVMAEEAGVTRVLAKPVSEDVLVTLVADAIAGRLSESQHEQAQRD